MKYVRLSRVVAGKRSVRAAYFAGDKLGGPNQLKNNCRRRRNFAMRVGRVSVPGALLVLG
jgi:hypothetical protein